MIRAHGKGQASFVCTKKATLRQISKNSNFYLPQLSILSTSSKMEDLRTENRRFTGRTNKTSSRLDCIIVSKFKKEQVRNSIKDHFRDNLESPETTEFTDHSK